jgi:hypothetical protein
VLPPPASSADWGTREVEEEADWGGGGGAETGDWELGFRSAFIPRQKKRRLSATPTRRFHLTASWPRNLVPHMSQSNASQHEVKDGITASNGHSEKWEPEVTVQAPSNERGTCGARRPPEEPGRLASFRREIFKS